MDNKVLEEIEQAILEEQEAELKMSKPLVAEVADYPAYLTSNKVTLSLSEYIGLYESTKALNKLIDLCIEGMDLTYNNKALRVYHNSEKIADYIKELEPLRYVEKYESLLEKEGE